MARNNERLFRESNQPFLKTGQDLPSISTRQICTPNAALEERVSGQKQSILREVQADRPFRVAGSMHNLSRHTSRRDLHPFLCTRIWWSYLGHGNTHPPRLLLHDLHQRQIELVVEDRSTGHLAQPPRPGNVVEMCVRHHDLCAAKLLSLHHRPNLDQVSTWIHHHRFARRLIAHDRAVALQRTYRKHLMNHRVLQDCKAKAQARRPALESKSRRGNYFFAGTVCVVFSPLRTLWSLVFASSTVRPMEVTMKSTALQVVSFVRRLAAPRGPKAVCDPCPPKAPARSALLPC